MPFVSRYSLEKGQVMNVEGEGCRGRLSRAGDTDVESGQSFSTFSNFFAVSIALTVLVRMPARGISTLWGV
jgi:hypothetical protein